MSESLPPNAVEQAHRREQARIRQRRYREHSPRIDFHPDAHAVEVVNSLRTRSVGGDASSIINRIIFEWSTKRRRVTGIKAHTARLPERPANASVTPEGLASDTGCETVRNSDSSVADTVKNTE